MLKLRAAAVSLALGSLLSMGCGEDPESVPSVLPEGGASPVDAMVGVCTEGASQSCQCPASGGGAPLSGSQQCTGGAWLNCLCSAPVPVGTAAGECLAGQYSGSFKGDYRSGFALLGLFSIPVEAQDFTGQSTGLSFTLNESSSGGGLTEFATFTISNGFVRGTANGTFPFEGILTGSLDCATKKFTGELEGCYALGVDLAVNVGRFKGPVVGTYDTKTHTFTMGTWDIKEMMPNLGGTGVWNAAYKGPAPMNQMPPGAPACKVRDGASPADAGVPDASTP